MYASRCFRWLEENGVDQLWDRDIRRRREGRRRRRRGERGRGRAGRDAPTESRVTRELVVVLRGADLTVDTEKAIRQRLEERMGMSLKEFKPVIRETIEKFLAPAAL